MRYFVTRDADWFYARGRDGGSILAYAATQEELYPAMQSRYPGAIFTPRGPMVLTQRGIWLLTAAMIGVFVIVAVIVTIAGGGGKTGSNQTASVVANNGRTITLTNTGLAFTNPYPGPLPEITLGARNTCSTAYLPVGGLESTVESCHVDGSLSDREIYDIWRTAGLDYPGRFLVADFPPASALFRTRSGLPYIEGYFIVGGPNGVQARHEVLIIHLPKGGVTIFGVDFDPQNSEALQNAAKIVDSLTAL